jgi:hypothetical protein
MITKTEGYKTSDGAVHGGIEEAIARELSLIEEPAVDGVVKANPISQATGTWIARNREKIASILSIEVPKRRTRKPRAAKPSTQPALTQ